MENSSVNTPPAKPVPPKLATPESDHRRQMLLQVWLPLGICLLVFLALCILIVISAGHASPELTRWSNMSAIWMIILIAPPALLVLAVLGGLVYLLARLLRIIPPYAHLAQAYMDLFAAWAHHWLDRIVEPVLQVQGFFAGARALRRRHLGK
jgi:small-conductance mechanosensitive channel